MLMCMTPLLSQLFADRNGVRFMEERPKKMSVERKYPRLRLGGNDAIRKVDAWEVVAEPGSQCLEVAFLKRPDQREGDGAW